MQIFIDFLMLQGYSNKIAIFQYVLSCLGQTVSTDQCSHQPSVRPQTGKVQLFAWNYSFIHSTLFQATRPIDRLILQATAS
jgi:hypothetical protein